MMKLLKTGIAISPSGKRVSFGFYEAPKGKVKTYRIVGGGYFNWQLTTGWNFTSIAHAIEIITNKGWSVEIDK